MSQNCSVEVDCNNPACIPKCGIIQSVLNSSMCTIRVEANAPETDAWYPVGAMLPGEKVDLGTSALYLPAGTALRVINIDSGETVMNVTKILSGQKVSIHITSQDCQPGVSTTSLRRSKLTDLSEEERAVLTQRATGCKSSVCGSSNSFSGRQHVPLTNGKELFSTPNPFQGMTTKNIRSTAFAVAAAGECPSDEPVVPPPECTMSSDCKCPDGAISCCSICIAGKCETGSIISDRTFGEVCVPPGTCIDNNQCKTWLCEGAADCCAECKNGQCVSGILRESGECTLTRPQCTIDKDCVTELCKSKPNCCAKCLEGDCRLVSCPTPVPDPDPTPQKHVETSWWKLMIVVGMVAVPLLALLVVCIKSKSHTPTLQPQKLSVNAQREGMMDGIATTMLDDVLSFIGVLHSR